jgi:DNA-directed RNA polymerase subunit N (RpoN/RPB10)
MYPPIRCRQCGDPRIGVCYEQIIIEMKEYIKEHRKISSTSTGNSTECISGMTMQDGIVFGPILDKYGLDLMCCRTQTLTNVCFHDVMLGKEMGKIQE